jgi:hypothetical protein
MENTPTMSIRTLLAAAAAVYYLTKVLLFEEKTDHYGPFPSTSEWVHRKNHYAQPVTLFDRVRRWTLNPYDIDVEDGEGLWHVDEQRMERWTCPKCLSFWISLAVTIFILVFIERPRSLKDLAQAAILIFGFAGATSYLTETPPDVLQLRQETTKEYTDLD